jgi:hypothetical protein
MALWNLQKLEGEPVPAPAGSPAAPAYVLELLDEAGKPLLHLEEVGPRGKDRLMVRTREGSTTATALIPLALFRRWQEELHRLAAAAKPAAPSPAKSESGEAGKGGKD